MIRKGGSNWVDGGNFFGREAELEALAERMREGTHTLLSAQRRMGKTSLVRELLRRLVETGEFEIVFIDLEAAISPADAIAEIGVQARHIRTSGVRIKTGFAKFLRNAGGRIEELSIADLKVKLRAGIDAGNWPQRGDAIFAALAENSRPVVVAIDELPIFVNRLLKDDTGRLRSEGKQEADVFLSWLRKAGQAHRNRITLILSGSVSLEPLLEQAGLSAHANIYLPYNLKPWSEEVAASCLEALAKSYGVNLGPEIRRDMCRRLRCCIPHHVQMFFDRMHNHLRHAKRKDASLEDVERVYVREMQGVGGQVDLQHYEERLEKVLGRTGYTIALEILAASAVEGEITAGTVDRYRDHFEIHEALNGNCVPSVDHVLRVLQQDGYLERSESGYRFVSGLIEDWWQMRYGQSFVPVFDRQRQEQGLDRWQ